MQTTRARKSEQIYSLYTVVVIVGSVVGCPLRNKKTNKLTGSIQLQFLSSVLTTDTVTKQLYRNPNVDLGRFHDLGLIIARLCSRRRIPSKRLGSIVQFHTSRLCKTQGTRFVRHERRATTPDADQSRFG